MTARAGRGGRGKAGVRTAKGRTASSRRWLERQLSDPYVAAAKKEGYRSRAAFKLIGLDDRLRLLKPGRVVVDLGAAPGGWTQVAVARVGAGKPGGGRVVAVDTAEMEPVPGAEMARLDLREAGAVERLAALVGSRVDVVLSDMAAPATGHRQTDHLRSVALCEAASDAAAALLRPGGALVMKALMGGSDAELIAVLKRRFDAVRHVKPEASRPDSRETYIVATGFRGGEDT